MTEADWKTFLTDYSRELLANERIRAQLPSEVTASGWLGYSPATEEDIAAVEKRLGRSLSPSYRAFLRVSNGWRHVNRSIYRLWPCADVNWFRVRNFEWIAAYTDEDDGPRVSDEQYFVYGEEQDSVNFRTEYLKTALEISDRGDDAIFLLNPEIVTSDGEWEAWFFANWLPGARRYRSFADLMIRERRELMEEATQTNGRLPRHAKPSAHTRARTAVDHSSKPWWRRLAREAARILVATRKPKETK